MIIAFTGDRAIIGLVDVPRDDVHDSYRRAVVGPKAQALNFETTAHAFAALRLLPPEEDASAWQVGHEADVIPFPIRGDDDAADRRPE